MVFRQENHLRGNLARTGNSESDLAKQNAIPKDGVFMQQYVNLQCGLDFETPGFK
jgi:hypothetical protein